MEDLQLGEIRVSRNLLQLAGSTEKVVEALDRSKDAYQDNTALGNEFNLFAATAASRMQLLRNAFQTTRIELGGKFAPVLIGILDPLARLSTATVGLTALVAGLTAAGFGFQRFSRIFREVTGTLGGGQIPVDKFNAALSFAAQRGISVRSVLRGLKDETLVFTQAADAAAVGTITYTNAAAAGTLQTQSFAASFTAARAAGFGFAKSLSAASAASNLFGRSLKGLGIAAGVLVAVDLGTQVLGRLEQALINLADPAIKLTEAEKALLGIAEGTVKVEDTFKALGQDLGDLAGGLAADVTNAVGDVINKVPFLGRVVHTQVEEIRRDSAAMTEAFTNILPTLGFERGSALLEEIRSRFAALGAEPREIEIALEGMQAALDRSNAQLRAAGIAAGLAGDELDAYVAAGGDAANASGALGAQVRLASGELFTLAGATETARSALSFFASASAEFDKRVEAFSAPFGQTLLKESDKAARAGRKTEDAARRVADAERDLAQAREDAAERIADAERKLAEAEEDAAERVAGARRKLEQTRFEGRRRIRDAIQELHDFEEALARAGGAQTPEDLIRLRELREAVSDARADNTRSVREGLRDVKDAEEEGREAVIEAQRQLAEAHEEAAEKIEDAARRIQDAQRKSGEAAGAAAENIIDTIGELVDSFQTDARLLNEFSTLMDQAATRVFSAFGDQEVGEAFLAGLVEMGVEAIPILRDLVNDMDRGELKRLEKVFSDRIKGAKKAADFQFDKFPDNWTEKMFAARKAAGKELEKFISQFDQFPEHTSPGAAAAEADLIAFGNVLESMVTDGLVQLDLMETGLLEVGTDGAQPSLTRIEALRTLMGKLKAPKLNLGVNTDPAFKDLTEFLDALEAGVEGKLQVSFGGRLFRQHGGFLAAGQPAIVGETGKEFFIPNTDGTVLPHQLTERILSALSRFGGTRGGTIQYITVNEVANDPIATARSVSWAVGQGAIR